MANILTHGAALLVSASALILFVGVPTAEPSTPDPRPVTYAPAVMPAVEDATRTPILLVLDADLDAGWNIAQAAQDWNDATGCELFTLVDDGGAYTMVAILQDDAIATPGQYVLGGAVSLNPGSVDVEGVAAHELGHVLGLEDGDTTLGVMSGYFDADRSGVSGTEARDARSLQFSRCRSTL